MGLFDKFKAGLQKTRDFWSTEWKKTVASHGKFDEDMLDDFEEIMVRADCGVAASEEIIEGMKKVRDSFNSYPVDRLTQQIGAAAMLDREYFEKNRVALIKTRTFITEELRKIGFEIPDSSANFIFAKPPKGVDAETLYKNLKAKGILVRYFSKPVINEYLRITIGTDDEMKAFLEEVRKEI